MEDKLNRREFLKKASMATVAGTTGFLVGCNTGQPTVESAPATSAPAPATEEAPAESAPATSAPAATAEEIAEAAQDTSLPEIEWQMATSWPVALDTIFGGAQVFAERAISGLPPRCWPACQLPCTTSPIRSPRIGMGRALKRPGRRISSRCKSR